mgnify:FL=1
MTDMKKGLIFVLFALVSIVSYSQISWNAKVGMNMSNFTGDMDTDMRIGFNVGVGMEYQFSDMWSIQPSLMFTQKGAKQDEVKMNPMYLEIPVLAAARFAIADNQNIVVKAGPYFAFGIAGKCKIGDEKIDFLLKIRSSNDVKLKDYAEKFGCEFHPGEKPWGLKVDMAFPCATQNEIGEEEAKQLIANGCKYIIEGANMPSTPEAIAYFTANGGTLGPAKAANAGGVAVSALEMSQNSMRYNWSSEEVDEKLHNIMKSIFNNSVAAAEKYGLGFDLIKGANIAGFEKVVEAMISQGIY